MRLAFDASILGRAQLLPVARSGIYRYADSLLQALAATGRCDLSLTSFGYSLDAAGITDYLADRESLRNLPVLLNPAIRVVGNALRAGLRASPRGNSGGAARSGFLRKAHQFGDGLLASAQQHLRPLLASRLGGVSLFHTPFLHIPPALRTMTDLARCVTVHDLNPIAYPEHFPPVVNRWSAKVMKNIGPDDWVLTVSQYVKDDLCERYKVDPQRVRVTYLAADKALYHGCADPEMIHGVRQRYRIPDGPYILSLGSLSPHKNIRHLVKCFAKVIRQERIADLQLVLAGTEGWMLDSLTEMLGTTGDLAPRIVRTGFVHDEDQAALYGGATAFVFPSLCEGFGLPPLEAMQCGAPVICANATSLPEVVGTSGILVAPDDEDALCQAIINLYRDKNLRMKLVASGFERARQFSWARCADTTLDVYREALGTKS
jgi:glycosyltransferase involved in cell wall biosynthesis